MNVKEKLKRIPFLRKIVKDFKIKREINCDKKIFVKYYQENFENDVQYEYAIMLLVHSLEKGFCHEKLRPFGEQKVIELVSNLINYEKKGGSTKNTAYIISINILNKWKNLYDENKWNKSSSYFIVNDYLSNQNTKIKNIDVGSEVLNTSLNQKYENFDYLDAISTRHSVRNYKEEKISDEDIDYCVNAAILTPTACNRQMIKLYYVDNKKKKDLLKKSIIGLSGFNKDNVNLFVVTYDTCAFSYYGERNQGYLNAGLFSMNLVNAMHFKGIGSCFLQWGNTNKEENFIKENLGIPRNERIAIVIAAGYYLESSVIAKSVRKRKEEIYKKF